MYIVDELRVEGRLHANAESGGGSTGGGGAGGSILVYVKHLDGEGSIEATGGRGKDILVKMFLLQLSLRNIMNLENQYNTPIRLVQLVCSHN